MSDLNQEKRIEYVRSLSQTPVRLVLATTGGGSFALADLLSVPGASHTVIEGIVPYSYESLSQYVERVPEHFCSVYTARVMATAAFYRARNLTHSHLLRCAGKLDDSPVLPQSFDVSHDLENQSQHPIDNVVVVHKTDDLTLYQNLIGVGCSASLSTDREKKGDLRVHVAVQTLRQTASFSLTLQKGIRSRLEEERLVGDMILNAIETIRLVLEKDVRISPYSSSQKTSTDTSSPSPTFDSESTDDFPLVEIIPLNLQCGENIRGRLRVGSSLLVDLFFGNIRAVLWRNGKIQNYVDSNETMAVLKQGYNPCAEYMQAVFPGSFNPIHRGHLEMINIAESGLQSKVALELSLSNVAKPPIDYIALNDRLALIEEERSGTSVWLTQTPLFEDKAEIFPGATFIVGADTLRRFADLNFYREKSMHYLHDVLRTIALNGCRFLVFVRDGESLETLEMPDMLRSLCDDVPATEFAMQISSSIIRKETLNDT